MLRILLFLTFAAIVCSFGLAFIGRVYLAETVVVSATIAYAILMLITVFKSEFKFRKPYISEIVLGGLLLVVFYEGYAYARAQPMVYYLFCGSFIIRTLAVKGEEELAGRR
ncbi:hypothetical protein E0W68_00200 [Flavobacterium salilacus subsp. salilacus]|uniref:hypothetical protein n=1 Tax=Flavobacterium TaxID=237 RepID=UPI001074ADFE|nr:MULTISPECIES: hypothetical protein [Flavobacterium]KAF2519696.1 hypothetical protein E0W68_00200 [Flavobacterium salilacus subsp. salilacus]MBE1614416.1 hypothetical protein [Flavobacterium sp. SaA2.13]NDI97495.1 hypothetical protein [Flavobacterium salilacus subsp. altitudinum]